MHWSGLLCACLQEGGAPPIGIDAEPKPDLSAAVSRIEEYLDETGLEGAGFMVVVDDAVACERYFGAYDAGTVVKIASASKWLSGALVMALVEDGKIALDDPVSKHLAPFGLERAGSKRAITIRQLFNHTSGLPPSLPDLEDGRYSLEELARIAAGPGTRLEAEPGAAFSYGGIGMQVGGRVLELATGEGFVDLFARRIARPLGLESMVFGSLGSGEHPLVYGGARSTMRDYMTFLRMLLNDGVHDGEAFLKPESVRELLTDRTGSVPMLRAAARRLEKRTGYGVGCWIDQPDADHVAIVASSPGVFGFKPWIDRRRRLAAILMIEDVGRQRLGKGPPAELNSLVNEAVDAVAKQKRR